MDTEYDAFDAGIEPGGLRKRSNIRLLICYIMSSLNTPLKKDAVVSVMQKNGIANYFETLDAFNDLIKNGSIIPADEQQEAYFVSDSGKMISANLSDELPLTIRERATASVMQLLAQEKRERENVSHITKINNGCVVDCHILGEEAKRDLFSFEIFVPDSKQAKVIKKNFQNNAEFIYKVMVAAITNDKDFVEEALREINDTHISI